MADHEEPKKGAAAGGHDEHDDHGKKKGHKKHGGHGHGGGHAEHEEGVPEWIVSFADNALLQMGFFVIMFAMNVGPKASSETEGAGDKSGATPAYLDMVIELRKAFHSPVSLDSTNPNDLPLIQRMKEKARQLEGDEQGPRGDKPGGQAIRPTDYSTYNGLIAFDQGSSRLTPEGEEAVTRFVRSVQGQRWIIEVRGHVSAQEASENGSTVAQAQARAHALAYQRALAVCTAMAARGIPWDHLRIASAADHQRVRASAYDAAAHRSNQRVEIIVTQDAPPPDPHARAAPPAAGDPGAPAPAATPAGHH